jgi:hypothetical protein
LQSIGRKLYCYIALSIFLQSRSETSQTKCQAYAYDCIRINRDGNGRRGIFFKNRLVCSQGGKQSSKAGAKAGAHVSGKGHIVRVGIASDSTDRWQKAARMCRRSKQGLCANTSKNAILTYQRNDNS